LLAGPVAAPVPATGAVGAEMAGTPGSAVGGSDGSPGGSDGAAGGSDGAAAVLLASVGLVAFVVPVASVVAAAVIGVAGVAPLLVPVPAAGSDGSTAATASGTGRLRAGARRSAGLASGASSAAASAGLRERPLAFVLVPRSRLLCGSNDRRGFGVGAGGGESWGGVALT